MESRMNKGVHRLKPSFIIKVNTFIQRNNTVTAKGTNR